ncbi:unnamed protein product, partial [Mesorhabditis spiculigera]
MDAPGFSIAKILSQHSTGIPSAEQQHGLSLADFPMEILNPIQKYVNYQDLETRFRWARACKRFYTLATGPPPKKRISWITIRDDCWTVIEKHASKILDITSPTTRKLLLDGVLTRTLVIHNPYYEDLGIKAETIHLGPRLRDNVLYHLMIHRRPVEYISVCVPTVDMALMIETPDFDGVLMVNDQRVLLECLLLRHPKLCIMESVATNEEIHDFAVQIIHEWSTGQRELQEWMIMRREPVLEPCENFERFYTNIHHQHLHELHTGLITRFQQY